MKCPLASHTYQCVLPFVRSLGRRERWTRIRNRHWHYGDYIFVECYFRLPALSSKYWLAEYFGRITFSLNSRQKYNLKYVNIKQNQTIKRLPLIKSVKFQHIRHFNWQTHRGSTLISSRHTVTDCFLCSGNVIHNLFMLSLIFNVCNSFEIICWTIRFVLSFV